MSFTSNFKDSKYSLLRSSFKHNQTNPKQSFPLNSKPIKLNIN